MGASGSEATSPAGSYGRWCRPKMAELLECLGLDALYVRARGAYLHRRLDDGGEVPVLDLAGGFGAGLLGHNPPELVALVREQLDAEAPFLAQGAVRREAGDLAERLNGVLGLGAPYVCHLTNSGAEAIEAALKHAYKVRLDAVRREFERISRGVESLFRTVERDHPEVAVPSGRDLRAFRDDLDEHNVAELERFQRAPVVVAFKGAFHGKTTSALKVTFNRSYREAFEGLSAIQTEFIDFADVERLQGILGEHGIEFLEPRLEDGCVVVGRVPMTRAIALCLEVIQGEGGVRPVPDGALAVLATSHDRLGLPYVVDEIQTGCGRTGTFLAMSATPLRAIAPEYVTLSKALGGGLVKIAATMIREDVYDPDFGILHTSTFAEDELGCRVAARVVEMLTRDEGRLLREVGEKGEYFLAGLRRLARRFPAVVGDVRGRGLMLGLELGTLEGRSPLFRLGARQGFLSLIVASYLLHHHRIRVLAPLATLLKGNPGRRHVSVLRLQPPVGITRGEIDRALDALAEACTLIERNQEGPLVAHLLGVEVSEAERRDPPLRPVQYPKAEQREDFDARVGFVMHPTHVDQVLRYYFPSLAGRVSPDRLAAWWSRLARFLEPDLVHTARVGSSGFAVEVEIVSVPFLPAAFMEAYRAAHAVPASRAATLRLREMRDRIQDAVTIARDLGDGHIPTSMVGLGAYTSIVTDRGTTVNDFDVPITTGNAYTAGLVVEGIERAAALRGLHLERGTAAVVGAAGNIGRVLSALLAARVGRLKLVGSASPGSLERLRETECCCRDRVAGRGAPAISIHQSIEAVRDCDVVAVATSSPEAALVGPDLVKEGAIVCCASVPSNLGPAFRERPGECLVFDGGYARLPEGQAIDCIGMPRDGLAYGCLSETILLGLEGRNRSFALGPITPEQVDETLDLARRYGFSLGALPRDGAGRDAPPTAHAA
jgi:acetylornithine/succinyldiaminopimelate/putrescine aminotransferase/predicted amino acid dehydrogenase